MAYKRTSPVPIVEGGTNATSMANTDGVLYYDGTRLVTTAVGTSTHVLTSNGTGVAPTFQAAAGGGISTIAGNSGTATGATVTFTGGAGTEGKTVAFAASGSTVSLDLQDANDNVGIGSGALSSIAGGTSNIIIGSTAGQLISSGGGNSGFGNAALMTLVSGSENTALGDSSGNNYDGAESNNICINSPGTNGESNVLNIGSATGTGFQQLNKAVVCGITGITVTGTAVLISTANQLGVAASSRQFKNDIRDMDDASSAVMQLRPVTFVWNKDSAPGLHDAPEERQFGLIAEEVAEIIPELVSYKDNAPFTVKYNDLPALLLNEIQKLTKRIESLEAR